MLCTVIVHAVKNIQLDSRALRVLAHPLRSRLLSQLRLHGAANATALAERLGTNTGATSYHLRKLAEVGLVEETAEGTGKQRFWAAAQDSHSWRNTEHADDPDARPRLRWLRRAAVPVPGRASGRVGARSVTRWPDAVAGRGLPCPTSSSR